ncbi:MAG: hypothetical protein LQ350_005406 [Teloschistes chrysophthalmus]|nr:MAG: hypothetical protein LQ350_005406 [Niorma chrysophthalma]
MAPTTRQSARFLRRNAPAAAPARVRTPRRIPTSAPLLGRDRKRSIKCRARGYLVRVRKGCWTRFPAISDLPRLHVPVFEPAPAVWASLPGMGLAESRMRRRRKDGGVVAGDDDGEDPKALAAVMEQRNKGHMIVLLRARIMSIMAENSRLKHLWAIQLEKDTVSENLLGQIDHTGLDVPDPIPMDEAVRMRLARESRRYGDAITQVLKARQDEGSDAGREVRSDGAAGEGGGVFGGG